MIVTIIIGIICIALLAQSILETIWGICMIIQSLCWHAIAAILEVLALVLDASRWIKRACTVPSKARA